MFCSESEIKSYYQSPIAKSKPLLDCSAAFAASLMNDSSRSGALVAACSDASRIRPAVI